MYQFKNTLKILALFLQIGLLNSCLWMQNPKLSKVDLSSVANNSSFRVDEIQGTANINYKDGFSNSFTLHLKTCIKDSIKRDSSIQDARFEVEYFNLKMESDTASSSEDKKVLKLRSNELGCINWSETYPYKYLVKPRWIGLIRTIRGAEGSAYQGSVPIRIAVNPWIFKSDEKFPNIIDIRPLYYNITDNKIIEDNYTKNGLTLLTSKELEYPQLWAPNIRIQVNTTTTKDNKLSLEELIKKGSNICKDKPGDDCYSRKLNLNILIPLELRFLGIRGQIIDQVINSGKYKLQAQLVAEYPKGTENYHRVHKSVLVKEELNMSSEKSNNQGTKFLSSNFDFDISYFNSNAIYKIIIDVEIKDKPFKKFQGIYTLKNLNVGHIQEINIDSELDAKYKKVLNIKYKNDKNKIIDLIENLNIEPIESNNLENLGFKPVTLDVNVEQMRFSNVQNDKNCSTNESIVTRTIQYTGEACLKDFITGSPERIKFRIVNEDPQTGDFQELVKNTTNQVYETDSKGCIKWGDKIFHKIYNRQRYFIRHIHFISEKAGLYGQAKIAISPWQEAFQFYQDITQLGEKAIRTSSEGVEKPKLVINQFKSVNFYPSYLIDKFLNLHLYHNLYFLFQPIIERPDNVAFGKHHRARELIRNGYYLLRLLMIRSPQETGDKPRVSLKEDYETKKRGKIYNSDLAPKFTSGEYLTHVDTVVKARANFANMYVPVQFNTQQFLHLGSRNHLSIQMYPADPRHFAYKKGSSSCELDLKKTKWKPYNDHDLEIIPYSGPFTPQNWTNWNVLQPTPKLKTDSIIDQSITGKKHRYFSMDSLAPSRHNMVPEELVETKGQEPGNPLKNSELAKKLKTQLEARYLNYTSFKDVVNSKDILKKFSKENSLKIIDFSNLDQTSKFLKDFKESGEFLNEKTINLLENLSNVSSENVDDLRNLVIEKLDVAVGEKTSEFLKEDIVKSCDHLSEDHKERLLGIKSKKESFFLTRWLQAFKSTKEFYQCSLSRLHAYLAEEIDNFDNKNFIDFENALLGKIKEKDVQKIYDPSEKTKSSFLKKMLTLILKESSLSDIKNIVKNGITKENYNLPQVGSFVHNLCSFWFKKYFSDYLEAEQMISSHTNFVSRFKLTQVVENENNYTDIINLKELLKPLYKEEEFKGCFNKYSSCLLKDHCKERIVHANKSNSSTCIQKDTQDESCKDFISYHCSDNKNSELCKTQTSQLTEKICSEGMETYCRQNPNQEICGKYLEKCFVNYQNCSKNLTAKFKDLKNNDPFQMAKKEFLNSSSYEDLQDNGLFEQHPFRTCLSDPFEFFNFENKVIVEELDKNGLEYKNGTFFTFSASGSHSIGSYMNWTAQRGTNLSTTGKVDVDTGIGQTLKFKIGGNLNVAASASANSSNSGRRAIDVRVIEGVYLNVAQMNVGLKMKKFKKCLVIKPRANAFTSYINEEGVREAYSDSSTWKEEFNSDFKKITLARSGLILCNPKQAPKESEKITETYYYISQANMNPESVQVFNPFDIANRPFVLVLRGKKEFLKYFYLSRMILEGSDAEGKSLTRTHKAPINMFTSYPHPIEEFVGLSLRLREFNDTGFEPGIFTYNDTLDLDIEKRLEKSYLQKIFDKAADNNPYFMPSVPDQSSPYQE